MFRLLKTQELVVLLLPLLYAGSMAVTESKTTRKTVSSPSEIQKPGLDIISCLF